MRRDSPPASATFQVEASRWLDRRETRAGDPEAKTKTICDLDWRLSVVMEKFGPVPIDQIDFALADELVIELCEERAAIERAEAEGVPLMRSLRDPRTDRSYEARRRGISNGSIRKALDAADRVLRDAHERGVLTCDVPTLKSAATKADLGLRMMNPRATAAHASNVSRAGSQYMSASRWPTCSRYDRSQEVRSLDARITEAIARLGLLTS